MIDKIVEDLVYALNEPRFHFNEFETSFIESISERENLTPKQEHAAGVIWDKRLRGREEFTRWDEMGRAVFDGKIYARVLEKLCELFVATEDDDAVFSDWERTFIEDVYTKYHPDGYLANIGDKFNPIMSDRQMEHVERIHEAL